MILASGYEKFVCWCRGPAVAAQRVPNSRAAGMTLLEVLVVLALLGITTASMAGGLVEWRASLNRKEARSFLEFDIKRMRSEATGRGSRVLLTINEAGTAYEVGVDYAPFSDPPAQDLLLFTRVLPRDITIASAQTLMFDSRGFLVDSGGTPATAGVSVNEHDEPFFVAQVFPTGYIAGGG